MQAGCTPVPSRDARLLCPECGAGGATKGYQEAGFEVVGIDINPQPNYCGDHFAQADALGFLRGLVKNVESPTDWHRFATIHASPPCHAFSTVTGRNAQNRRRYPDLIDPVRNLLEETGLPYVIENVVGAPLRGPVQLCGSSFGLDVRRHRRFEANFKISAPPCNHAWQTPRFRSLDSRQKTAATVLGVHGHLNYPGERELREGAMGIDWMSTAELSQAIPPVYTEWIGRQLFAYLRARDGLAVAA